MDNYNGATDTQSDEEKKLNYKLSELVTAPQQVVWEERPHKPAFTIRDQDGSGMCVAMTYATEMGILFMQRYGKFMDFSSTFPYQKRTYPEQSGCTSTDIYSVWPKLGNVFESFMPSQQMSDAGAMAVTRENYYEDLASVFKVKRIQLPINFETVASTIQATGKGVMVWFRFSGSEWTTYPTIVDKPTTSGHSVTAIDFILIKGKKYLVIQDSWGLAFAEKGIRYISEEYFKERCFLASYLMNFDMAPQKIERPIFDGTIMSAQKCFKWEGLFPNNVAEIENWGNITRTACIAFQKRYGIEPALGNFGPITKEKLRQLYHSVD